MTRCDAKEDFWKKQARRCFYTLWALCGCYFAWHIFGSANSASTAADRITYAKYPAMSIQEVESKFAKLQQYAEGEKFTDAALYFQLLGLSDDIEKSSRRMELEDLGNAMFYREAAMRSRLVFSRIQSKFVLGKSRENFDKESAKHLKLHPITISEASADYSQALIWVLLAYPTFVFFTFGHNCIVLKRNGCQIYFEMMKDKAEFWYCPFLFPYGLFKYPHDIHPAQQVVKAGRLILRAASLFFGAAVTVCAQVGTLTKKVQPDKDDCQTTSDCYRLDVSTRLRNQYLGGFVADIFYNSWVLQTGATLSFPGLKNPVLKGLSLNIWDSSVPNTRPFGSGYGSEVDVAINWTVKVHGINVTATATYLFVYPLKTVPRGDVANASVTFGKTFKVGKVATLEPYIFNVVAEPVSGKLPNGGWITQAGATLMWKPKSWVTVTANPHGIHDSGAFGEKEGYLFGGTADIGLKVSKHVTIHPIEIGTGLPIDTTDHRRNRIVYGFGIDISKKF